MSSFIADEFSKPVDSGKHWEYMISCAIAENILDNGNVGGLVYPGVQGQFGGANIVMKPFFAEHNLIFDQAVIAQLHKNGADVFVPQFESCELKFPDHFEPFQWSKLDDSYQGTFDWSNENLIN